MRRIIIDGDKTKMAEQLEQALADVREGNPGYVTANFGEPKCEIEFSGSDPSEDPSGDWSELGVEYSEVPDG